MLPASWKPVPAGELVRVGSRHDGGYVIAKAALDATQLLLSMGLSDDWSFEEDFHNRTGARIVCFDGSVTGRFWIKHAVGHLVRLKPARALKFAAYRRFFGRKGIEHRRQMIGYDAPGVVSLTTLMGELPEREIFLKCDIEGGEYRIFDQIVANADRFCGIAMEIHDVDLHRDRITAFLGALPQFRMADFHGNNFCDTDPGGDPIVAEFSLVRADLLAPSPEAATGEAYPNDPNRPDIKLTYEPA